MDRYYTCSINKSNIVECVKIPIDRALQVDKSTVFYIDGQIPHILDSFCLISLFHLPVRLIRD
jgi:hypothetical protein